MNPAGQNGIRICFIDLLPTKKNVENQAESVEIKMWSVKGALNHIKDYHGTQDA